jgi:nitrite reductase/ring-hydroxylating ferredoxin subunit
MVPGRPPPLTAAATEQTLCRLDDIPDGASRGFLRRRNTDRVFAVRQGEAVFVYRNACPHQWLQMELMRDRFLTGSGTEIMCYAHGARFEIRTGLCTAGPCQGERLIPVPCRIEAGTVFIAADPRLADPAGPGNPTPAA